MEERHRWPAEEDAMTQLTVFEFVCTEHPSALTVAELVCAIGFASEEFEVIEPIKRAIRDLCAAGLLHRAGGLVYPSRPALYLRRLGEA